MQKRLGRCKQGSAQSCKQEDFDGKNSLAGGTAVPENQEMPHPLISIIIPVYNVASYLRESLDSAIKQSYKNLEIIIIDDGSTDGSGAICDEYKNDPRITVIHQTHHGVSNSRNVGLDVATGEYIAFLDADDAYHPDFIKCMLKAIEDVDVSVSRFERYKLSSDIGRSKGKLAPIAKAGSYDRIEALRLHLNGLISTAVWDKLYRKELWKNVRFPDGHVWEDIDVVYRIFDLCNCVRVVDRVLYFYRMRPGSITYTCTKESSEDRILAWDHLASFAEANIPNCFDETNLRFVRQKQMNSRIVALIHGHIEAKQIKSFCEERNLKGLSLSSRVAYRMAFFCPWLLKASYPIYRVCKMRLLNVLRGTQIIQ